MSFNILDPFLDLNSDFLVEASAGTGKTFTIEHLFVRRFLTATKDGTFLEPHQMAVVTFTKACAKELVERIRNTIDRAIQNPLQDLSTLGKDCDVIRLRLLYLKSQLDATFIGTIHGFCHKVLRDYFDSDELSQVSKKELESYVDDFFRYDFGDGAFDTAMLEKLLLHYKKSYHEMRSALLDTLWSPTIFDKAGLKQDLESDFVVPKIEKELLFNAVECFSGCMTKEGAVKKELQEALDAFCSQDLTSIILHPLFASDWFLKKKKNKELSIEEEASIATCFSIESQMRAFCSNEAVQERIQKRLLRFIRQKMHEKKRISHDEILHRMYEESSKDAFVHYCKTHYRVLIVDEFQDTDPIQWQIFERLFSKRTDGALYLVGDPKQAIYAFRNADVYSYMTAKNSLQEKPKSLVHNFRSTPDLISGLNALFSGEHAKRLFYLPKTNTAIDPPAIGIGNRDTEKAIDDGKKAILFFEVQKEKGKKRNWPTDEAFYEMLSFIVEEIHHLKKHGVKPESIACLVSDRFEQKKLQDFLQDRGIETQARSKEKLSDSAAYHFLLQFLKLLLSFRSKECLASLVVLEPLSYTHCQVQQILESLDVWAEHVEYLKSFQGSFSVIFQSLLKSRWPTKECSFEALILESENGVIFLRDLEALFSYIVKGHTTTTLENALEKLTLLEKDESENVCHYNPLKKAVEVHTLHGAKGLEFEYVFIPGVCKQKPMVTEDDRLEALRLFYVATTRAKKRLYIPIATAIDEKTKTESSLAPVELFVNALYPKSLHDLIIENSAYVSHTLYHKKDDRYFKREKKSYRPKKSDLVAFPFTKTSVGSFTRLLHVADNKTVDHRNDPLSADELFWGPNTATRVGRVLHELLDTITSQMIIEASFFEKNRFYNEVEKLLETTFLSEKYEIIAPLLYGAFHVPLDAGFSLSEIDFSSAFSEAPFFAFEKPHTFSRGVIDLYFEHDGKYYMIDWKSSFHLSETVLEHYKEQARMYAAPHIKNRKNFGGFYCLFIRFQKAYKMEIV